MAERHQFCNCDAPMPAALCTAVCFERRDDVAAAAVPGDSGNDPHSPAGTSSAGSIPFRPAGDFSAAAPSTSFLQVTAHIGELS